MPPRPEAPSAADPPTTAEAARRTPDETGRPVGTAPAGGSSMIAAASAAVGAGVLQRKILRRLARRGAGGADVAEGATEAVAAAAADGGAALPGPTRERIEGATGADLSSVRVHTGSTSQDAAQSVNALAYTVGQDIHFGAGQYQPGSRAGDHLIAHEVAHTLQPGGAAAVPGKGLEVSDPADAAEHEADAVADAVVAGRAAPAPGAAAPGLGRKGDAADTDVGPAGPAPATGEDPSTRWSAQDEATIGTATSTLGVMGAYQGGRVRPALEALDRLGYTVVRLLLDVASSVYVRAFLFKALAASNPVTTLAIFAASIAGKDLEWLLNNCTGGDALQEGTGTKQAYKMSCGPTTVQTIHAEYDPVYALKLHTDNPDLNKVDNDDPKKFSPKAAEEQRKMLESTYHGAAAGDHAGLATSRNSPLGSGRWVDDWLTGLEGQTGLTFTTLKDPTGPQAVQILWDKVSAGMMTPVVIGGGPQSYAHYNLVMNTRTAQPKPGPVPPAPAPAPAPPAPAKAHPLLVRGSEGDSVEECQNKLNQKGAAPPLDEDSIFGPLTEQAVKDFQGAHSLDPDGKVGPKTWARLDELPPAGVVDDPPQPEAAHKEFMFHDPGAGATVWMTEQQVKTGTLSPGWPMVTALEVPSPSAPKPKTGEGGGAKP